MIIALSSHAAPAASLGELIEGCSRRGITALHLVQGHGHGVLEASPRELRVIRQALGVAGVHIAAIQLDAAGDNDAGHAEEVRALLSARLVTAGPCCIEVNAAVHDVEEAARAHFGSPLDLIVLRGAGPEAAQHEGRGIGALMARLALNEFSGILSLAPSGQAVLPVWRAWLQHGRQWGCGSKTADPSLVQLVQ